MPVAVVAIPLFTAVASGAAAAVIAGTATFAAYATVAGAVLSTVGAITKNKDLARIGMFVSLGAGVAGLASGMSTAGSSVAQEAFRGAELAADAGGAVSGAAEVAQGASTAASLAGNAGNAAPSFDFSAGGASVPDVVDDVAQGAMQGMPGDAAPVPFAQQGQAAPGLQAQPMAPPDPVAEAGKLMTQKDLEAFYAKASKGVSGVSTFLRDNKELVNIGGEALNGALGPKAQYVNLQRERYDSEKSLLERARERLNNPIKLSFGGA